MQQVGITACACLVKGAPGRLLFEQANCIPMYMTCLGRLDAHCVIGAALLLQEAAAAASSSCIGSVKQGMLPALQLIKQGQPGIAEPVEGSVRDASCASKVTEE